MREPFLEEAQDDATRVAERDLDLEVLRQLPGKTIVLSVLDLGSPEVEAAKARARRAAQRQAA